MTGTIRRAAAVAAGVLLIGGAVAACGSGDDSKAKDAGADKSITIGYIPWDENIVTSELWKQVLEEDGYEVELSQLDVAPTFVGVANGDVDLFLDTWLPVTHEDYWKEYSDKVEDLGAWYDSATLNIAVPEYMDISTIAELKDVAGDLDNTIVGIESGAGLTRVTQDEAMPGYGLEDFTLQTSSTQAMLAALKEATDKQEPIAVTLWHPHWAYSAFPIKDLEDPDGLMGDAESIHSIAREGFSKDHQKVADAIKNWTMSDEMLADLEQVALQDHDDVAEGVAAWIKDNRDYVDGLLG